MSIESKLFWFVAEVLVNLLEVSVILWYLHVKLTTNHVRLYVHLIGGAFLLAVVSLSNFLSITDGIRIPAVALCFVGYTLLVYRGPLGRRIFQSMLAYILLGISDLLAISLLTFIPGVSFDLITQPTIFRLQSMVATKILFVTIIYFLANITKKSEEVTIGKYIWLLFLIVPVTSGGILGTLINYELRLNDTNALPLLVATIGILVINITVLVLLQVLSFHSKKILNQEMLLQQNDIQAKYFTEIKSTNDNLRGFRHDLNNHLQVLHGYISLGKYEKANAYLNEIGDFVALTGTLTNTGHDLLDAVIGTKITYARKLNIRTDVYLQVPANLPLSQMELCSVLSNILDNAIEACDRLKSGSSPKELSLKIDQFAGHLRILLKNTAKLEGAPDLANMISTKKEPGHGIGLSNMKRVVYNHGGQAQFDYGQNEFSVLILLPLKS